MGNGLYSTPQCPLERTKSNKKSETTTNLGNKENEQGNDSNMNIKWSQMRRVKTEKTSESIKQEEIQHNCLGKLKSVTFININSHLADSTT